MYGKNGRSRASRLRPGHGFHVTATSLSTRVITRRYDPGHELFVRSLSGATLGLEQEAPIEYEVPPSGWPPQEPETALTTAVEYEVPPQGWGPSASPGHTAPEYNRTTPYEQAPVPQHQERVSQPPPSPPAAAPQQKPPAAQPGSDSGAVISEDVLMSDIQSILSAGRPAGPASPPTSRQANTAQSQPAPTASARQAPSAPQKPLPPNRQEIFDRIAESMSHARTYDLGSIALEQRFDAFDEELDRQAAQARAMTVAAKRSAHAASPPPSTADLMEDLDWIRQRTPIARAAEQIALDPGVGGRSIGVDALDPGDVILSTTSAGLSRAIRAATGAPVSHSAIYIGNNQVVEAIDDGVILRSLDTALEDDSLAVAYRHRDMTAEKAEQVVSFLTEQARQRRSYDRWGLIRAAPGQLARTICNQMQGDARRRCLEQAASLRVGTDDQDAFFCSELVLEALRRAGLSLSDIEQSWSSPGQILDLHYNGLLDYVGHLKV